MKRLILLKIQNVIDIKEVLLQWFMNFFDKKTSGSNIKNKESKDYKRLLFV